MAQLLKEKGKKEVCPACHNEITCGETTYKGETKLQWQNKDGKAHYSFDASTQKTSCKSLPISEGQTKIDETDPVVLWTKDTYETELKIRGTLRKLMGGEPDPAHVGMYLNLRKKA